MVRLAVDDCVLAMVDWNLHIDRRQAYERVADVYMEFGSDLSAFMKQEVCPVSWVGVRLMRVEEERRSMNEE
jgi:hypothetical protein